ncbi:MAG: beta-lactamase class, partial [Phenylobacterium sp.]|nr:beta-lactamase class [Phenylobacterium sp.]
PPARQAVAGPVPEAAAARPQAGVRLQSGQPLPPGELETFVDGLVEEAMARRHIAGATVSVVQNGQILLKKGYGFASLAPQRPVDPDKTLFRLGSLSQTFTWIGLMKEAEAGRIRLDQPVNLYLPERVQVRDQGFDQPVRVIDLMDHSAGFEDRAFGQLFERDPDYVRPLDLYLRRERPRRVRPPGLVASYSNYGAALAGEATAWTSGRPFERLMEEEVFLPLGMRHTTFRERRPAKAALPAPMPQALADDAADGFRWRAGGFQAQPYEYIGQIAPAGSASSSAGDMARYMLAILGNGQLNGVAIYGARTAEAFRTPILPTAPGVNGWAHGSMVETLPGGRQGFGHEGSTLSFTSNMVTVPALNLGVFVATNSDSGRTLAQDLPRAIVQEFYAAPRPFPQPASPELAADAAAFAGHYLSTRRAVSGLEGFIGRLAGAREVKVTPQGRLLTMDLTGRPRSWTPHGPPDEGRFLSAQGDEPLVFKMRNGRASAYQTSDGTQLYERVGFWRSPPALGLFGALTAAAAVVSLVGAALRNRRELRETQIQSRAALVQNIQAGLWLAAMGLFAAWAVRALDPARLAFGWPGPLLVTASACALVAAALTVTTLVALPAVWRGGRRVDSWPVLRKLAFCVTVAIYAVFAYLVAQAGALSPWSG